jgi:hypothetical protein
MEHHAENASSWQPMPENLSANKSALPNGCSGTSGGLLNAPGYASRIGHDLLSMHDYGKEGPSQLWLELIPYWSQSQRLNGGIPCPDALQPDWIAEINCRKTATRTIRSPDRRPRPVRLQAHHANPESMPANPEQTTPHANPKHLANHD